MICLNNDVISTITKRRVLTTETNNVTYCYSDIRTGRDTCRYAILSIGNGLRECQISLIDDLNCSRFYGLKRKGRFFNTESGLRLCGATPFAEHVV